MKSRHVARMLVLLAFAAFGFGTLAACETVKGVGKDIQNVGEAGEDAIDGEE